MPHINVSSVSAAQNDAKLIQGLLENVKTFNSIFQDALDKVYSLKPEDDQPLSEIELWRQRSAVIGTLYEAMFTPDFKLIVQVLERVENETVRQFSKLRQEVSKTCLEARDNTRFLSTLERHFKLLQRQPISALPEVITSLYAAVRMVWTISRYFNTEQRLVPLLERVSAQINNRATTACAVGKLFARGVSPAETLKTLEDARKTLERWIQGYNETRERIQEDNKEAQRWEFDRGLLFGRTEFLLRRLEKLTQCSQ